MKNCLLTFQFFVVLCLALMSSASAAFKYLDNTKIVSITVRSADYASAEYNNYTTINFTGNAGMEGCSDDTFYINSGTDRFIYSGLLAAQAQGKLIKIGINPDKTFADAGTVCKLEVIVIK